MDEREWLASEDPVAMLELASKKASDGRLQMFAAACLRCVGRVGKRRGRRVELIEAAEDYADGLISKRKLHVHWPPGQAGGSGSSSWPEDPRVWALALAESRSSRLPPAAMADLVRCLFGNPFRPATLDPPWRSPAVLALTQAAYDHRDLPAGTLEPNRLAVLADALEESGCSDAAILGHLRGAGPHWRGCWCVDLLLGRE